MYRPNNNNYEVFNDTVMNKHSTLLPSLQNCNKNKSQACLSVTTTTSHIQSNISFQQHSSRSNGYFTNDNHMISNNSNTSHQLYSQHSFLDSVQTNNNGLLEHDTFSDYSTNIPTSPKGAEQQILMILMCNGMTPEFDQFNGKFNFPTHNKYNNRLRLENTTTTTTNNINNGSTPSSSSSTTPSSSISSPNCNDNFKTTHLENSSTTIIPQDGDIYQSTLIYTNVSSNTQSEPICNLNLSSESSNKLDENLTLPPSPCVSDISETEPTVNTEQIEEVITTNTITTPPPPEELIPHKIESVIHDSINSCPNSDRHGETTDESSDDEEEEDAPKAKSPKRESRITKNRFQKTMKLELQLDSAESSGFVAKPAKTYSFRDATIYVLTQIGKPMTAVEITKFIFENKMVKSEGKTPERTVAAMIYQEMKKKKNTTEFALFGSGVFGLSAWKSDDHTSQDTASVSTDASLSSHKSVDRTEKKKKKEKKKRKLSKPEKKVSEPEESDNELPVTTRKPRRMHKPKTTSSSDEIFISDSEQVTCKKKKPNECEEIMVTEETLFQTYISKLKKKEQDQTDEDECFVCKNGGELICCDYSGCKKVYHTSCVGLEEVPQGDWVCPHHYCSECKKKSVKKCFTCPYSVCDQHVSLLKDKIDKKFVCAKCKPMCELIK